VRPYLEKTYHKKGLVAGGVTKGVALSSSPVRQKTPTLYNTSQSMQNSELTCSMVTQSMLFASPEDGEGQLCDLSPLLLKEHWSSQQYSKNSRGKANRLEREKLSLFA
jgi:hypothetical protein